MSEIIFVSLYLNGIEIIICDILQGLTGDDQFPTLISLELSFFNTISEACRI